MRSSCTRAVIVSLAVMPMLGCAVASVPDEAGGENAMQSAEAELDVDSKKSTDESGIVTVSNDARMSTDEGDSDNMLDIPVPASVPGGNSSQSFSAALSEYVRENYPDLAIRDIQIIGNGEVPSQQTEGETDYWCSYLVMTTGGDELGIQVTGSASVEPYATEMTQLPVDDATTYDLERHAYVSCDIDGYGDDVVAYRQHVMQGILDDPDMMEQW